MAILLLEAAASGAMVVRGPNAGWILLRHLPELQVLWSVVVAFAVAVVYSFMLLEEAAKQLLHDQTMLEDVSLFVRVRMILGEDLPVSSCAVPATVCPTCMSADVEGWVAGEAASGALRRFRNRCPAAAPTQAYTAPRLGRSNSVGGWLSSPVVSYQEAPPWQGEFPASTLAGLAARQGSPWVVAKDEGVPHFREVTASASAGLGSPQRSTACLAAAMMSEDVAPSRVDLGAASTLTLSAHTSSVLQMGQ